jgi:DNA-binding transcriptional regulator YhcF (GntR family)/RNA polymerase subunit RPABC4/transcription elongation factor Spt4
MVGLRKRMGDFDMTQAGQMLQAGQAMGDCLTHYRRYLDGQTAIAFCCSVAHAEAVADLFQRNGVAAASIDGTMDGPTRERLLSDLGAGRLKVLTSCALIGEGVDVPSVAGCILLRPTQSVSLHLQMIGRCLRPQPGKTAVILDHVGNTQRLGHHLEEREWSLDGTPKRDREAAPSVKVCPKCFSAMPSAARECPDCGHEFVAERRELQTVDGELVEVERVINWKPPKNQQITANDHIVRTAACLIKNKLIKPGDKMPSIRDISLKVGCHRNTALKAYQQMETLNIICSRAGSGFYALDIAPDQLEKIIADFSVSSGGNDPRLEQATAGTLDELIAIGRRRGMKSPAGWARHVMAARSLRSGKARVRELVS